MISCWLLAVGVFVAAALTQNFMIMENNEDRMLHITGFCIFMLVPTIMLPRYFHITICALAFFVLGVGIEYLQEFVPGRSSSLRDVYSDVIGIMLGLLVGYLFRRDKHSSPFVTPPEKTR